MIKLDTLKLMFTSMIQNRKLKSESTHTLTCTFKSFKLVEKYDKHVKIRVRGRDCVSNITVWSHEHTNIWNYT